MADTQSIPSAPGPTPPGIVEPFYFGEPPLYGSLHAGKTSDTGIVVCSPVGHEYITFHRAARQIANQVSRGGRPVLRFDYSGTGDSAGDLADARLETWVSDVRRAMDELRRRTAVERLSLVGVRLGASLALLAAAERDDVESIALWDPVISGPAHLKELERDTRRMLRVAHVLPSPPGERRPRRGTRRGDDFELLGFTFPGALVGDLRGLELDAGKLPDCDRILLLETTRAATAPLGAVLRGSDSEVETLTEALPHAWRWSEDITRVQLPHAQVRAVARWIAGGTR